MSEGSGRAARPLASVIDRQIYEAHAGSRELARVLSPPERACRALPPAGPGPPPTRVEFPRPRLVPTLPLPAVATPRIHEMENVHGVRRRGRNSARRGRDPVCKMAAGDDGAVTAKNVGQERRAKTSSEDVKARAIDLGFSAVGVCTLEPSAHADFIDQWLAAGYGGTMTYLNRQAARRKAPQKILPNARCAVV